MENIFIKIICLFYIKTTMLCLHMHWTIVNILWQNKYKMWIQDVNQRPEIHMDMVVQFEWNDKCRVFFYCHIDIIGEIIFMTGIIKLQTLICMDYN